MGRRKKLAKEPGWIVDAPGEQLMEMCGINWEIQDVDIKDIDLRGSRHNNARIETDKLNDELAAQYAEGMKTGVHFPMPILQKGRGRSKLFTLSGNHRVAAAEQVDQPIRAYVTRCTDEEAIDIVVRVANSLNGTQSSAKERIEQIYQLHHDHGRSLPDLAALFNMKLSTVQFKMRLEAFRHELADLGIQAATLPLHSLDAINRIRTNEQVMVGAAELAISQNMTAARVKDMVGEVKAERGERKQLAVLKNWNGQAKQENPKRGTNLARKPLKTKLTRFVNTFGSFLTHGYSGGSAIDTLRKAQITGEDKAPMRQKLESLRDLIDLLLES